MIVFIKYRYIRENDTRCFPLFALLHTVRTTDRAMLSRLREDGLWCQSLRRRHDQYQKNHHHRQTVIRPPLPYFVTRITADQKASRADLVPSYLGSGTIDLIQCSAVVQRPWERGCASTGHINNVFRMFVGSTHLSASARHFTLYCTTPAPTTSSHILNLLSWSHATLISAYARPTPRLDLSSTPHHRLDTSSVIAKPMSQIVNRRSSGQDRSRQTIKHTHTGISLSTRLSVPHSPTSSSGLAT